MERAIISKTESLVRKSGIVLHFFIKSLIKILIYLDSHLFLHLICYDNMSHFTSRKLHCALLRKWSLERANNILLFIRKIVFTSRIPWKGHEHAQGSQALTLRTAALSQTTVGSQTYQKHFVFCGLLCFFF